MKIGDAVERREDRFLVDGSAPYTDDLVPDDALRLAVLRSQHAHARITNIDTSEAAAHDGVVGVFIADDLADAPTPAEFPPPTSLFDPGDGNVTIGRELFVPRRPLLARDRVRHVGQPIVAVVARDQYRAIDALRSITVEYERLEAVTDPASATADSAPLVHDEAPGNIAFDWEIGDSDAVADIFADADHTVAVERPHQRLIPMAIEPRAAIASFEAGRLDVTMPTQVPFQARDLFAHSLGLPVAKVRVHAPRIGGGFGSKSKFYYGEPLAAWCALRLGQPVAWTARRSESFVSDAQGRARESVAELAFDRDGAMRALRVHDYKDLGAFISRVAPSTNTGTFATLLSGQYAIPAIHARVTGVFTNLPPSDAYRGSSRPDAAFLVERLVSAASRELDMDPVQFRKHNFIPPAAFPYETPVSAVYDSGQYAETLDLALEHAGYPDLRRLRQRRRDQGGLFGIGVACFVEKTGAAAGRVEAARVRINPDGTAEIEAASSDQGQGHETSFAQIVSDRLGIEDSDIAVSEGDTRAFARGSGTFGSRTAVMAGNAVAQSVDTIIEQGKQVAGYQLETAPADVVFEDGHFAVSGAPEKTITLTEVATAVSSGDCPDGLDPVLEATTYYQSTGLAYSYGAHLAAVSIDDDTGEITIERYVAVDDCGNQINPTIVDGQVQGGIAQGLGQALLEGAVYDENGSLLSGSLMDYALPRAEHIPNLVTDHTVTPSPTNPLGVKGAGESGTVGAPTAISNAVHDALAPIEVTHIGMPMHPEKVWRAINDARGA